MSASHNYPLILYQLSVIPLPSEFLAQLERKLFRQLWAIKQPTVRLKICCLHPSEGCLGMPNVKASRHTLRVTFLERMNEYEGGWSWRTGMERNCHDLLFLVQRHERFPDRGEVAFPPRPNEPVFYRECQVALRVLKGAK